MVFLTLCKNVESKMGAVAYSPVSHPTHQTGRTVLPIRLSDWPPLTRILWMSIQSFILNHTMGPRDEVFQTSLSFSGLIWFQHYFSFINQMACHPRIYRYTWKNLYNTGWKTDPAHQDVSGSRHIACQKIAQLRLPSCSHRSRMIFLSIVILEPQMSNQFFSF